MDLDPAALEELEEPLPAQPKERGTGGHQRVEGNRAFDLDPLASARTTLGDGGPQSRTRITHGALDPRTATVPLVEIPGAEEVEEATKRKRKSRQRRDTLRQERPRRPLLSLWWQKERKRHEHGGI